MLLALAQGDVRTVEHVIDPRGSTSSSGEEDVVSTSTRAMSEVMLALLGLAVQLADEVVQAHCYRIGGVEVVPRRGVSDADALAARRDEPERRDRLPAAGRAADHPVERGSPPPAATTRASAAAASLRCRARAIPGT